MAALPAQPRTVSNQASSTSVRAEAQTRVEFIAVTQSDELLEQLGQALDGESAIRHAETIAAARELVQAAQPCVVMLDAREHAEPGRVLEVLQPPNGLSVIVVFAPADQTNTIAQAIKRSATFAVLPLPVEIAKTAAVLEGAREEAMARRNVVAEPQQAPSAPSASHVTSAQAPRPAPRMSRPAPEPEPVDMTALPVSTGAPTRSGSSRGVVLGAIAVVALLAVAGAWFFIRGGETTTVPAASPVEEPVAEVSIEEPAASTPIVERAPVPTQTAPVAAKPVRQAVVPGAIDELLEKALIAFQDRRYTDPEKDNALLYYRSVLAQEPDNGEATEGLMRIGGVLDGRLQSAMTERRYDEASATLAHLKLIKPNDPKLKATEGKLVEVRLAAALQGNDLERAAALLRQASQTGVLPADRTARMLADVERRQTDARAQRLAEVVSARIRDGRLVEPASDSAKYHLAQLRKVAEDSKRTTAAERELGNAYLQRAREAGAAKQTAELERWLGEARELGVSPARISTVQREARAASVAKAPGESNAGASLVQARIADGRLLDPAQDSAVFHWNALRASDPAAAAASGAALSARLIERGRSALAAGRLDDAQRHVVAARQLGLNPSDVDALEASVAAARQPMPTGPVQVSSDQLKRTRYVAPSYPRQALEKSLSGDVRVRYTVDTEGRVRDVAITASNPPGVFDDVALAAVRRWRFKPYELDGQRVEAVAGTVLVFRPDDGSSR